MKKFIIYERVQKICKEFDTAFNEKNLDKIENNFEFALELLNSKLDEISKCNLYYSIGTAHSDYIQIWTNRLSVEETEYNLVSVYPWQKVKQISEFVYMSMM